MCCTLATLSYAYCSSHFTTYDLLHIKSSSKGGECAAAEIRAADIGTRAGLFEVQKIGDEFFTFIVDCDKPKACSIVLRGASKVLMHATLLTAISLQVAVLTPTPKLHQMSAKQAAIIYVLCQVSLGKALPHLEWLSTFQNQHMCTEHEACFVYIQSIGTR